MLFATRARVKVTRLKFRITTTQSGHVRPATQIIRSEDVAGFESWYQSSVICFGRHVERLAFHFINFALPLAECPCSTSRASSNRWMLPDLNRGTDHLVIRFDGHVERIAFYFIAA
jgi:hypothetical protein